MDHLDLGDGQWADIRTRLTFGQVSIIRRAALASATNSLSDPDIERAYFEAMVAGWDIRGTDGAPVPYPNLDLLPANLADRIFLRVMEVFRQFRADPKDASDDGTSPASSPSASSPPSTSF